MAKISELPNSATPLTGEETFPVVQLGITKKARINDIRMTVDSEMSDTSENPVQNKVVKAYADGLAKYRIISDVTITEDIGTYSISQDSNGNTFDLRKLFFLFIGKFDNALNNTALSLRTNGGYQYLMYKGFTLTADKECAFWLEAEIFLRTSENSGFKSTYSATLLQQFSNGLAQGLSGNNVAVNSDISFQKRHPNYPHPMSEIKFGVHSGTQKMKSGSRFIILGIDY
jgi:hypothetical protein